MRCGLPSRLVYYLKAKPPKLAVGLLPASKIGHVESACLSEDVFAGVQSTSVSKCVLVRPLVQPPIVVIGVGVFLVEMPKRCEHIVSGDWYPQQRCRTHGHTPVWP